MAWPDKLACRCDRGLDLDRPGIVGHSLGGRLALGLAEAYPEHVSAVAVLACAGLTDRFDLPFLHSLAAISDLTDAPALCASLLGTAPLDEARLAQRLLAQLGDSVVQARLRHYLGPEFRWRGDDRPRPARLDPNRLPDASGLGIDDTIVTAPACPPGALRTHALDHVGHMPHLTAPETVNRLILDFFAEATPQPQRISVAAQE